MSDIQPEIRIATLADVEQLAAFTCSQATWYSVDAQEYVRTYVAVRVALGLPAWVVDDGGVITAVASHEAREHPLAPGDVVTFLSVVATRDAPGDAWTRNAVQVARLLTAVLRDIATTGHALCYTLVAEDNAPMRRFCDGRGFNSVPVPSDPRYRFYAARLT